MARAWRRVWRRQKNGPAVACQAGKFWERMPERQFLYDLPTVIVQLRNRYLQLQFLQFTAQVHEIGYFCDCFNRNELPLYHYQLIAGIGCKAPCCGREERMSARQPLSIRQRTGSASKQKQTVNARAGVEFATGPAYRAIRRPSAFRANGCGRTSPSQSGLHQRRARIPQL